MNRNEVSRHFDSLLLKTYDNYYRKNRYEIENTKKNNITEDNFSIPKINEHNLMLINKYNLKHLKEIIKYYKLKLTGKKEILIARIFSYLYLSKFSLKIQKNGRNYLSKKYINRHGPAYLKRDLCVNAIDFLTMDDVKNIIPTQFFSYNDKDNFIYGFDAVSFYNLIKKSGTNVILNPFTKSQIPSKVIHKFKQMIFLSDLLNIPINLKIDEEETTLAIKTSANEAIALFQYIDQLGNYTNVNWFTNLSKNELLNLIMELFEIWNYRADLSYSAKIKICNPSGNPFYSENFFNGQTIIQYLTLMTDIEQVRLEVLEILSKFVKKGLNDEYKKIGAHFVLGALTLVSRDAENSLPWLYESFSYN
jgi:hypothetical protein